MAIFSPMTPNETETFVMDFTRVLGPGEKIISGTVTATVLEGTDATPQNIVSGGATPVQNLLLAPGKALAQKITLPKIDNHYRLSFRATTDAGNAPELQGDFWCLNQVE